MNFKLTNLTVYCLLLGLLPIDNLQSQEATASFKNMTFNVGAFSYDTRIISPYYLSIERNRFGQEENTERMSSLFLSGYYLFREGDGNSDIDLKKISLGYKIGQRIAGSGDNPLVARLAISGDLESFTRRPYGTLVTRNSTNRYGVGLGVELIQFLKISERRMFNFALEVNDLGPYYQRITVENPQIQQDLQTISKFVFSYVPKYIVAKVGISFWTSKSNRTNKKSRKRKKRR